MTNSLHSFFIYVFFGYFLLYPLLLFCLKIFAIKHPKQRMAIYITALLTPFAGFTLYHTVLSKRCQIGSYPEGFLWRVFDTFCWLGDQAIRYMGPVLIGLIVFGVLKALVSMMYVARLRVKNLQPDQQLAEKITAILTSRAAGWGMQVPRVIYTNRPGYAAFAVGLKNPVIVISLPVANHLSDIELNSLITHEMVHIRRGDNISGWLLYLLRDMMIFSPFSTALLRSYLLERERLCDWETAKVLGSTKAYALTLLKVSRLLLGQKESSLSLSAAFIDRKQDLEPRILSLLAAKEETQELPAVLFIAILLTMMTVVLVYLGFIC